MKILLALKWNSGWPCIRIFVIRDENSRDGIWNILIPSLMSCYKKCRYIHMLYMLLLCAYGFAVVYWGVLT